MLSTDLSHYRVNYEKRKRRQDLKVYLQIFGLLLQPVVVVANVVVVEAGA